MQNQLDWKTAEDGGLPMTLDEKGLGLKGSTAFFFYFSSIVSLLSMIWVIVISIGVFIQSKDDASLPSYYPTVAIGCIALSAFMINTFIKFFNDKRSYRRHVEINGGTITYLESTNSKKTEWTEKLRKYSSVDLMHYRYKGVDSWYIALNHNDKERRVVLFTPEYKDKDVSEDDKHQILDKYGKIFELPTNLYDLETSYKLLSGKKDENEKQ